MTRYWQQMKIEMVKHKLKTVEHVPYVNKPVKKIANSNTDNVVTQNIEMLGSAPMKYALPNSMIMKYFHPKTVY